MRPKQIAAPRSAAMRRRGPARSPGEAQSAASLLALQVRSSWKFFASQGLAFQAMCIYLVVEYVRPQQIFSAILGAPLGQIALGTAVIAHFFSGGMPRI